MLTAAQAVNMLGPCQVGGGWEQRREGDWLILAEPVDLDANAVRRRLYHGTCLSQAANIVQSGFRVGPGNHNGAYGLWGLWIQLEEFAEYPRGHALERARPARGWLEVPDEIETEPFITGWTCPVVISLKVRTTTLRFQCCADVRVGDPESRLAVWPGGEGSVIRIAGGMHALEIHIHVPTYRRYTMLPILFPVLQGPQHSHVACQARSAPRRERRH